LEFSGINFTEDVRELLDNDKLKYCFECGTCTATCPVAELTPRHFNPRVLLQKISLNLHETLTQPEIWLCTWCDRCPEVCPKGINPPEIFFLARELAVRKEGYLRIVRDALRIIERETPLSSVVGSVCMSKVAHPPAVKEIRLLVAGLARKRERKRGDPMLKTRGEKIAVIGSGPAGLTAAYELIKKGYPVTVFETLPKSGGMLRFGIPEYRLPKILLDVDIDQIRALGVEIRNNVGLGRKLEIRDLLLRGYGAVFISIGAHKSNRMDVGTEESGDVVYALDFLKEANMGLNEKIGDRVVIIGGGNVAVDSARVAKRIGAKDVSILYRRSREEMPANPLEVQDAVKEGVKFRFCAVPKKVLDKDRKVTAIECNETRLGELDETCRRRPIPIEGSEFIVKCDKLILAIGETPKLFPIPKGMEISSRDTILVDPISMESTLPGVFAGGDVVSGPATLMEAIVAGRRAAVSIDLYLQRI
jgi:NADPH-dependent glutamate synthase beta subunit-like oxidoreductase